MTVTSGPGLDLKSETIGLAISVELPLIVLDIQRAGPSTGMPTKTEQGDLLHAMFGRHGEAPLPIVAPSTPSDCFDVVLEASRLALKYRTPVIVLSDAFLATGSEPWKLPDVDALPDLTDGVLLRDEAQRPDGRPTSGRSCATRTRSRVRGRSRGRLASSTASAASRSRTARATSPTTRTTTTA